MDLYIGLMSGTSIDGIDVALVDFHQDLPRVIATHYIEYPPDLREKIFSLCLSGTDEIARMGALDVTLGKAFAYAARQLLDKESIAPSAIKAIGCHGQTIRHAPYSSQRFTLQIGDPNTIATETGITTVADFRRKDMALGGHGAPLVPAFHQCMFASSATNRAIVNIGGIANVTLLPSHTLGTIIGFDTGPGNALLDSWIQLHQEKIHDDDGKWAAQGHVNLLLLQQLLRDPYFHLAAPKSTGREYFNLAWLNTHLSDFDKVSPVDVQSTLTALTAHSTINAIKQYFDSGEILICGGGTHNSYLMSRITLLARSDFNVASTQKYGVDPDWIEATAFAWLARQTMNRKPGNLPSVTGAKQAAILGGVYYPD